MSSKLLGVKIERGNLTLKNLHLFRINQENWKTALTSGCSLLNSRQYTLFMKLFKELGDIKSIIEVSLWLLSKSPERLMLLHIIDSLRDHELESAAMGKGQKVVDALYKKVSIVGVDDVVV